ncbi:MAG: glycosyltransferase [Minisyncoccia bacterium]
MSIKVLSIGSDRKLFEEGSAVSERIKEYGNLAEELHIVVFALKSLGLKEKQLAPNVWIYPTNSSSRWSYVRDASELGKRLVVEKKFVRGLSVITTQDPFESGLAGLRVKNKWRLPLEVQLHTDPNSPYFTGFLNRIRKIIAKRVLANADSVRDVKTLPIYVDKEKIENGQITFDLHTRYPWRFILLTVSRLAPEKNIGLALRALALVRARFPDTGLVIVGSGPEEGKLKALARELKLEGGVEFAGWQDNLASFYKTANAFMQTSFFEGYGLALVEAGLSGLPVITTPVGIATELENEKDAYIYPANRPDLFANGVIDLIENNQKREGLRTNMKSTLDKKLISKVDYMAQIKANWEKTSQRIKL